MPRALRWPPAGPTFPPSSSCQRRAGAPSLVSALQAGRPVELASVQTIADGIAVKRTGDLPFRLIKELVDRVVAVADEDILRSMVLLIERSKIVVEGAGAAALAAVLSGQLSVKDRKVVLVLSGGNVDIRRIGRILEHGLAFDRLVGRLASLRSEERRVGKECGARWAR